MEQEQPHHHKHHREEHHNQTGGTGGGRKLPVHPAWLFGVGVVLTILVILVWTLLP